MFDRLGSILRSYLDDDGQDIFSSGKTAVRQDEDYQEAVEELNDFLDGKKDTGGRTSHGGGKTAHEEPRFAGRSAYSSDHSSQYGGGTRRTDKQSAYGSEKPPHGRQSAQRTERASYTQPNRTPPKQEKKRPPVPPELYKDFIRLGLAPGASFEMCKKAHKNLMKKHHPDRHANNPFAVKSATEISSGINVSFQRIVLWYQTGRTD